MSLLDANLSWIVAAWLVGVCVLSLRIIAGWIRAQQLRRCRVEPPSPAWQERLVQLARQLGITRAVQLLQSHLVRVPTMVGHLKPVILLPAAALTGLAPQQIESILAHELAHIRRYDYMVNLVQVVIETLLFYHPAVWWVSRRVRIERENCCDDLAIELCGDRFGYIRALVSLEELRDAPATRLAVAWQGTSLLDRVRRLLGVPAPQGESVRWAAGPVVLLAGIMTIAFLLAPALWAESPDASAEKEAAARSRDPWQHYLVKDKSKNAAGEEVLQVRYALPKEFQEDGKPKPP
jgi:beta-lactamase regulating signal transducer with metallopeptidase domain